MGVERSETGTKEQYMGPHGLGDPDDKRLRKVELNVLIKNRVREAAVERCKEYMLKFKECIKEKGIFLPLACQMENDAQMECLKKWFENEELNRQMTEEYLEDRTYYRATGIPRKRADKRLSSSTL